MKKKTTPELFEHILKLIDKADRNCAGVYEYAGDCPLGEIEDAVEELRERSIEISAFPAYRNSSEEANDEPAE